MNLVTGGAGFIGSHLVRALLEQGERVRVLDDLSSGSAQNLEGLGAELRVGDIRRPEVVAQAMEGVETVFHLAAMVSVPASMTDPPACYQVNLTGSLNILWAALQAGVRRVVLSSSCAVYGDAAGPADEQAPPRPLSPYAAAKLAMESAGQVFTSAYNLPTVALRYFNVYGPRQSPDSPYAAAIPIFIGRMLAGQAALIHGDGRQTRDFVYVQDVVQANLLAARSPEAAGQVVNVGSGRSTSILDLAAELRRLIPGAPSPTFGPARAGDIRFSAASLARAEQALGYRPKTTLAQGLHLTVEWFQEAPAAPSTTP